jgi:DNA-binding transcriptional LysR family regulator
MHVSDRIGRRMKLHDLHVLMAVVQAGGMGKAARRLNTSQSAISRSIAELEHAFGVRLLDRSRQGSSRLSTAAHCSAVERRCSMSCARA